MFFLIWMFTLKYTYCQANPEPTKSGILFHEDSKLLLADKFVNVEFLVPFPRFNFTMREDIEKQLAVLSHMWATPSAACPLNFSRPFKIDNHPFNLDWMVSKIQQETDQAQLEVEKIRWETAEFLSPGPEMNVRRPRAAAAITVATLAGIGLFGGGIMMGSNDNCGLAGVFGTCRDEAKENAANIEVLGLHATHLSEFVEEIANEANEKFYLVHNELAAIRQSQEEMIQTQSANWEIIEKQFKTFQLNFHILRDCSQMLLSNQQLNFNFDTYSSLLGLLYADIKSYKAALYAYRLNILNSIPTLLEQRLPMSIVPRDSLLAILDSVYDSQKTASDRLTLAIPVQDLLSYYDAKNLRYVVTVDEGLLLTLAIPLASSQTAFQSFRSIVIPMPHMDANEDEAIQWVTEGEYLAVSEDSMETTVLTKQQFDRCLGSSKYRICHETMETHLGQATCLSTLYFHNVMTALTVCETKKVFLPSPEKATNLGYGIWLLTSASKDYSLREYSLTNNAGIGTEHPGCHICLITLNCGTQLISKFIKIRPDLSSCDKIPAMQIDVKMPDPLASVISHIPPLDELPYFDTKIDAGISLLHQVKSELQSTQLTQNPTRLEEIAKPIAQNMRNLKPPILKKLETYVPIQYSLSMTIITFVGSILLHVLTMYLYHKFAIIRKFTPKFLQGHFGTIPIKQVIHVDNEDKEKFATLPEKVKEKFRILEETVEIVNEGAVNAELIHSLSSSQVMNNQLSNSKPSCARNSSRAPSMSSSIQSMNVSPNSLYPQMRESESVL